MSDHHKGRMVRFGMMFVAIVGMMNVGSFNIKTRHATFKSAPPIMIVDQSVVRPVLGIEPELE